MILGLVGALLLLVAIGTAIGRGGRSNDYAPARRILDARVVDSDISPAQREEMLTVLGEHNSTRGSPWLPWLLAIAGTALLIVPGVVRPSGGVDARWAGHWTVMADHMGWNRASTTTMASAEPGAEEITIEAGDLWFQPEAIEIPGGGTVNLTVRNTGAVFHDLTVRDLDLQFNVEAGDTTTSAIRVDTPGTYEFICSVPGHAAGGMRGMLIVTDTNE
ncbi:MAG: cupredoxin domain-containing protein [Nitriliruptoraceae bacterium]